MKRILVPALMALAITFLVGCPGGTDTDDIIQVLNTSQYTGEGSLGATDDGTRDPRSAGGASFFARESIPWVRFVRKIDRPVTRDFDITVTGTTADVIMTAHLVGTFYVANDPGGSPILIYQRPIADSARRRVTLAKQAGAWRITGLTPWDIYTHGSTTPVSIVQVRATARPSGEVFTLNRADSLLAKDDLASFQPGDTVLVEVTVAVTGDSSWTFLHRGVRCRDGAHRTREPLLRTATTTFSREWVIAADSILQYPALRHAAIDVIAWQTLFGGETAAYASHAWSMPYVVRMPGDSLPPDED